MRHVAQPLLVDGRHTIGVVPVPEHLPGQPTDSRSDLYAIGCIGLVLVTKLAYLIF